MLIQVEDFQSAYICLRKINILKCVDIKKSKHLHIAIFVHLVFLLIQFLVSGKHTNILKLR